MRLNICEKIRTKAYYEIKIFIRTLTIEELDDICKIHLMVDDYLPKNKYLINGDIPEKGHIET